MAVDVYVGRYHVSEASLNANVITLKKIPHPDPLRSAPRVKTLEETEF